MQRAFGIQLGSRCISTAIESSQSGTRISMHFQRQSSRVGQGLGRGRAASASRRYSSDIVSWSSPSPITHRFGMRGAPCATTARAHPSMREERLARVLKARILLMSHDRTIIMSEGALAVRLCTHQQQPLHRAQRREVARVGAVAVQRVDHARAVPVAPDKSCSEKREGGRDQQKCSVDRTGSPVVSDKRPQARNQW